MDTTTDHFTPLALRVRGKKLQADILKADTSPLVSVFIHLAAISGCSVFCGLELWEYSNLY